MVSSVLKNLGQNLILNIELEYNIGHERNRFPLTNGLSAVCSSVNDARVGTRMRAHPEVTNTIVNIRGFP